MRAIRSIVGLFLILTNSCCAPNSPASTEVPAATLNGSPKVLPNKPRNVLAETPSPEKPRLESSEARREMPAEIRVLVWIDGRDELRLFPSHATWTHQRDTCPLELELNGVKWNLQTQTKLENAGASRYSNSDVRFGKAELVKHQGRNPVQLTQDRDNNVLLQFDDPDSGADIYEVTVKFSSGLTEIAETPPSKPNVLRLDDGTEVPLEQYGGRYLGYDFRDPFHADDQVASQHFKLSPEVKTVLDYQDANLNPDLHLRSLALDEKHGKLYWLDTLFSNRAGHLRRANLDGSKVETLVENLKDPRSLALDLKHGKVYWMIAIPGVIQRANLDGSNVEDVVTDLRGLAGVAVDTAGEMLYFSQQSDKNRLFQSRLDGRDRKLLSDQHVAWQITFDEPTQKVYWCWYNATTLFRANSDGTKIEPAVSLQKSTSGIRGFAVDSANGKIYFSSGSAIRRSNLDGTQLEDIAVGIVGTDDGLVADLRSGHLYWVETYGRGAVGITDSRIRSVKIPPLMQAVEKPPPPLIEKIDPISRLVAQKIQITGQHLTGTTRVLIAGIGTGECVDAEFNVISKTTLEVTVPMLQDRCEDAAIIVVTPGGVTVTLPTSLLTVTAKYAQDGYDFDPWRKGEKFTAFVNSGGNLRQAERCLAVVSDQGRVSQRKGGKCVLFMKDGATTHVRFSPNSTVFFEPFALVGFRGETPDSTRLIPVSAIRCSFLKELFHPQKP